MTKTPRGRLYQHHEFVFDELDGLKIEQLVVCKDGESNNEVIQVFLKMENRNWHNYFLDAGIGFWENWDTPPPIEESDEDTLYVDYTEKWALSGKRIEKVYCTKDQNNSKIVIELENKEELVLKCICPEIFDSAYDLIRKERTKK